MKKVLLLFIIMFFLGTSCSNNKIPDERFLGEWAYIIKGGIHLADGVWEQESNTYYSFKEDGTIESYWEIVKYDIVEVSMSSTFEWKKENGKFYKRTIILNAISLDPFDWEIFELKYLFKNKIEIEGNVFEKVD